MPAPAVPAAAAAARRSSSGGYSHVAQHHHHDDADDVDHHYDDDPPPVDWLRPDDADNDGNGGNDGDGTVVGGARGGEAALRDEEEVDEHAIARHDHDRRRRRGSALAAALIGLAVVAAVVLAVGSGGSRASPPTGPPNTPTDTITTAPYQHDDSGPPINSGGSQCVPATSTIPPTTPTHLPPTEHTPLSRIAFGSCFIPHYQTSPALWKHIREVFQPELWVWLGDNMYMDTFTSMPSKRAAYIEARSDKYYSQYGPVAEPKIPVTGTWDDHDFGYDNMGREYPCLKDSQDEFVRHFNLDESDVRHWKQGEDQRNGVYSSQMFVKPKLAKKRRRRGEAGGVDSEAGVDEAAEAEAAQSEPGREAEEAGGEAEEEENGVHIINLDARSHRSPTYPTLPSQQPDAQSYHFACDKSNSTMLGPTQWQWFEYEMLHRKSVVKLIGSGVQVLPPTSRGRDVREYCSYDGVGGTFEGANADLGEPMPTNPNDGDDDGRWVGTIYEGWGEMPQERMRLLRLAQRSINTGMAKRIVFLTGDQHWAELMVKEVPARSYDGKNENGENRKDELYYGTPQKVYSVTASGIDQHYVEDVGNTNRIRLRSADRRGDGIYTRECNFPFTKDGVTYNDCADVFGSGVPGCSTGTDPNDIHIKGEWGNCLPEEEELVPRRRQKFGRGNKCTDNYHHTCSAQANYGGIVVDWERGVMNVTVYTPHEEEVVASSVEIDI